MTRLTAFSLGIMMLICIGCKTETCKINYDSNPELFEETLDLILDLGLDLSSNNKGWDVTMDIHECDNLVPSKIFTEIEMIEIHRDSTIFFQAPNCEKESPFSDIVYVLAYSPKGIDSIKKKRNTRRIEKVGKNWYLMEHINTLAN